MRGLLRAVRQTQSNDDRTCGEQGRSALVKQTKADLAMLTTSIEQQRRVLRHLEGQQAMSEQMSGFVKELEKLALEHTSKAADKTLNGFEALLEAAVASALNQVSIAARRSLAKATGQS